MLINPILDKFRALGLEGMLKALEEQLNTPKAQELGFEERLGPMVKEGSNPSRKPPAQKQAGHGQAPALRLPGGNWACSGMRGGM